jgi:hypothetical protein
MFRFDEVVGELTDTRSFFPPVSPLRDLRTGDVDRLRRGQLVSLRQLRQPDAQKTIRVNRI